MYEPVSRRTIFEHRRNEKMEQSHLETLETVRKVNITIPHQIEIVDYQAQEEVIPENEEFYDSEATLAFLFFMFFFFCIVEFCHFSVIFQHTPHH
jgi:hypothetical protein